MREKLNNDKLKGMLKMLPLCAFEALPSISERGLPHTKTRLKYRKNKEKEMKIKKNIT